MSAQALQAVNDIDAALARIADGVYGLVDHLRSADPEGAPAGDPVGGRAGGGEGGRAGHHLTLSRRGGLDA